MFNQSGYNRIKAMELSQEFKDLTDDYLFSNKSDSNRANDILQAYANSVERLLKGESNSYLAKANETKEKDVERSVIYHRQHNLIERLLTELKNLKP